jgi:ribosomal protein L11 methyltransferase
MNDKYFELTIIANSDLQEMLIAELAELEFEGFVQNDNELFAYSTNQEIRQQPLIDLFNQYAVNQKDWKIEEHKNQNWNETWESNFEPILVGNSIYIKALFHPERNDVEHTITIQPKMSFGTGHHSTTKLVLEEMIQLDFTNKSVLDMGCGTAVLAIYAEIKNASRILAIDNDSWAYENSVENCATNNCSKIEVKLGDETILNKDEKYDFIISNITKNFNLANLPLYAKLLNSNGHILLSGFYETDAIDFNNLASTIGLNLKNQTVDKNWTMLHFTN